MLVKYSIIIPHKNTPDLLKRCIDSIPKRNDIQIIVVDDNSDPTIVNFNNFPGLNENNVEVIFTKQGGGAGFARNIGLDKSIGKWVFFADSDDFYNKNFLAEADKYCNSDYDIIYFNIECVMSENPLIPGKRSRSQQIDEFYRIYKNNKITGEQLYRFHFTEPWAKMIRSELIKTNHIKFDETLVANDYLFSIKTGYYALRVHADSEVVYILTERTDSLSSNFDSSYFKLEKRIEAFTRVHLFLEENKIPFKVSPLRGLMVVILKKYTLKFIPTLFKLHKAGVNTTNLVYDIFRRNNFFLNRI